MLTSMRNAFATGFWRWVLIILMSVLIVSFAIWGISDIFRGFGRERLATIGTSEISAERFRNEFDRERQNLSRRTGQPINNEQARALGLADQLLQRLVAETALDEQARRLVLGVSDEALARAIVDDPNFTGGGSGFSRAFFQQLLQANNLTEAAYVAQRRQLTLRQMIAQSLTGGMQAPNVYEQISHRFQAEKRTANYIVLPADRFAQVAPPSEEVLTTYFSQVGAAFRAPERRTADLLFLVPQTLAATIQVSDEDARVTYTNNRARYGTPERRRVQQLNFENAAAATAALERVRAGTAFDEVVTAAGRTVADVEIGLLSREEVIDPAIREVAFGLEAGAVSDVVQGRFGPAILRVTEIQAGSVRPFEEVMPQIKTEMALERARRQVFDVHDRIEEERLSGVRLADVAQKLGLQLVSLQGIDRQGRDATGTEPATLPGGRAPLDAIFAAQAGTESDGIQLRDVGGYVWVDLKDVERERDRPLADVRDQVIARWTEEQRRGALGTKATELLARLRAGTSLEDIAKELDLEVKQTQAFTRRDPVTDLSRTAVDEVFRTAQGQAGSGTAENESDRVVFVVASSDVPEFNPETDQSILEELSSTLQNDIMAQYVTQLQRELGTSINRAVLERILNPTTTN